METLLSRAWVCPVLLVLLGTFSFTRAVDPIDFLESLKDDDDSSLGHHKESSSTEYPNGVNVIPGEADLNYPVYSTIPKSSFSCIGRPVGFYADTELRCQVWHICDEDRRQQSFLCTNGTVYSQDKRVCDWWYNVNCDQNEVMRNYLQNYDLYKGPPSKSENEQEQNDDKGNNNGNNNNNNNNNKESSNKKDDRNDFDYQPTTKSYNKDPFSQFPSSRKTAESQQKQRFDNNNNNDQQYSKPTNSYNEPFPTRESSFSNNNDFPTPRRQPPPPPPTRPSTTSTTTYRPPTTYNTPPPPAALQGSSFPPKPSQHQRSRSHHHQQPQQQQAQQQQKQYQQTTTPPPRTPIQPSIKTTNTGGKRIVEIRVPISQIPPEILAKYGKRIPENILKEIFLNFTRNQQQQLQQEAIGSGKPSNPTGASNSRSPPPTAPIPQNRQSNSRSSPPPPPPPPPSKKPVDFGDNKPSSFSSSNSQPPPPPPPPSSDHSKFRHSTPRKVDNVKFATPTRELLAEYEDERQQVGESQNPIYSLQQLFSSQHSRTSSRAKAPPPNEVAQLKESFNFEDTTTTTAPYQEFTRSQPREFTRSKPREYTRTPPQESRSQPQEFNRTPPQEFTRSQPEEFSRSKPQEFSRSKPQEFSRSKPQDFSRSPPEEFTRADPQEFTRSEPQEFTRSQPRRRTQGPSRTTTTTTTEEPQLITDRYFPVSSQEEKKQAEIKRIFLVAKQGIKVLPPIPVLSGLAAVEVPTARRAPPPLPTTPVTQRPKAYRTTPIPDFSRIPPAPKVSIPEDYFVQNERFEEAESRYPRPSIPSTYSEPQFHTRPYSRPTTTSIPTTTTTTSTTPPPPPPTPYYQEPQEFRRTKPSKPQQQNKKKPLPPPEDKKQQQDTNDYDEGTQDRGNTDELELLRLAQEYIELTGQDFGVRKSPRNA